MVVVSETLQDGQIKNRMKMKTTKKNSGRIDTLLGFVSKRLRDSSPPPFFLPKNDVEREMERKTLRVSVLILARGTPFHRLATRCADDVASGRAREGRRGRETGARGGFKIRTGRRK